MHRLYTRATAPCAPASLPPAMTEAIAGYAAEYGTGDLIAAAVHCFETVSVRLRGPGLMARLTGTGDPDTEHRTVVLITPTYVVVCVAGEKRGVHIRAARLTDVRIQGSHRKDAPDRGLTLTGWWVGPYAMSSLYVAAGDDEGGRTLRAELDWALGAARQR
ncbi:hypothetical protein [Streptomyces sp. NPDC005805]|uniref:hypothetical protein n=1 Tax=Streptomyces sp. NPDC005805 TaxID=3157068 RepID=UPI0033CFEB6C